MANALKGLWVGEISLVDAPANPGAVHVLFKRKATSMPTIRTTKTAAEGALDRLLTKLGLNKRAPENGADAFDPAVYTDAASSVVDKATDALNVSIASIMADVAVVDKAAAIAKSVAEFRAFTGEGVSDQIEKAMRGVAVATTGENPANPVRKDDTMPTPAEMEATIATMTKRALAAEFEVAKAKMSDKHKSYMADSGMSDDDKGKFVAASADDRDAMMTKAPVKKVDPDASVALTKALSDVTDLQKRLAVFEADREVAAMQKRATEIGVSTSQAETILKASKGDATAFGVVLDMIKAANEQARVGGVFKEFGASGGTTGNTGTAAALVVAKAEELRKADPKLSLIAARVAVRKADTDLAQRERDEERALQRANA
jgi:hypothetical protein